MSRIIPDSVYPYLRLQHDTAAFGRKQFEVAYWKSIEDTFNGIMGYLPRLPEDCQIWDIGGGMSGIGMFLKDFYGHRSTLTVIDGLSDEPVPAEPGKTFSNAKALADFYEANKYFNFRMDGINFDVDDDIADLVVSFAAWCFHIPPSTYLDRIAALNPEALILDVRRDKPEWTEELENVFGESKIIRAFPKFQRRIFGCSM